MRIHFLLTVLATLAAGGCAERALVEGGASPSGSAADLGAAPDLAGACETLGGAACEARADCHAVFIDQSELCDCASLGCCTHFVRCAPGPARCSASKCGNNQAPPPRAGPYVVGYGASGCAEGCVLATACPTE